MISQMVRSLTHHAKRLSSEATAANASLAQRMLETFHGLRLIRAFGRERHEQDRFDAASREVSKIFLELDRISGLVHPLSEVLTASLLLGHSGRYGQCALPGNWRSLDFPYSAVSTPAPH